jgi:luciferase family oxidoreductase group 1
MAAHCGVGFAFAHHINPGPAVATLRAYRDHFRPANPGDRPHAIVAVSVVCAPTDEEAEVLAAPVDLAMVRLVQGRGGARPSPTEVAGHHYSAAEDQIRRRNRSRYVVGGVERVRESLAALVHATGADELMVTTMVADPGARLRSYELLIDAFADA